MLMQNFKSAADLDISEAQKDALIKTLVMFETNKVSHAPRELFYDAPSLQRKPSFSGLFNMRSWGDDEDEQPSCGTVACIGGTAELIVGAPLFRDVGYSSKNKNLYELFYPPLIHSDVWFDVTPAQAATALRSYLTTGDARWDLAVA